jgi:hypothetical protein
MRSNILALVGVLCALPACSPTFNWREVRTDTAALVTLMPCKPDQASRPVPMAGTTVALQMLGCEAGEATFAVSYADIRDPSLGGATLAQWRQLVLANMQATQVKDVAWVPVGAHDIPQSVRSRAMGRRADGAMVVADGVWFARGPWVYHAVVYSARSQAEAADNFFNGLKLE